MKAKATIIILAIIIFSSCSTHKFLFFSSDDPMDDNMEFVFENDTIDIRYRFTGESAPMNIYIYNKSDLPLFIDWKHSAIIINSENISYWDETYLVALDAYSHSVGGRVKIKDRITYIAPHSYIESTRLYLGKYLPQQLPIEHKEKQLMKTSNGSKYVQKYKFLPEESPLWFRSRLTFSNSETFNVETPIESAFWISEVIQSKTKDLYMFDANNTFVSYEKSNHKPGNLSIVTTYSKGGGTVLGILIISTWLAVESIGYDQ